MWESNNAFSSSQFISYLVNAGVLAPVVANRHVAVQDLALRLELEEVDEVVLNAREVRPGDVAHGREEHALLGVAGRDLLGILGRQRVVPQREESADLVLGDGLAHGDLLGHDGRVVVVDLGTEMSTYVSSSVR